MPSNTQKMSYSTCISSLQSQKKKKCRKLETELYQRGREIQRKRERRGGASEMNEAMMTAKREF